MGLSKTEVNLRRLLAAAPQQQNQAKLIHYVATLREQLEQLAEEKTDKGLPRKKKRSPKDNGVPKGMANEYSDLIEVIGARLAAPEVDENSLETSVIEVPVKALESAQTQGGLRRRFAPQSITEDGSHDAAEAEQSTPVKLDASALALIQKHRKLQEDLTDEMVDLARQLKESSLLMSQSVKSTEKLLDSTEKAVEHSLASTGHGSTRSVEVYSQTSRTSCFTWLLMFVMTCIFIMVVLLIRVT